MRAESFYQTIANDAVSLTLLSQARYQDAFHSLPEKDRHCMTSQQFQGALGDIALIVNETGKLDSIYIGSGDGTDAEAIAQSVNKIPQGCYAFAQSLSKAARIIWSLAQYRFDRYKPSNNAPRILILSDAILNEVLIEASAIFYVRDLINTPTSDLGPTELAEAVSDLAKAHNAIFEQWVGDELLKHNFPAIHAVGRAAHDKPRLLSLTFGDSKHPHVSIVGKGVCFDSGGLDIKPANAMRLMKKDMGGAAQALGLAKWIMTKGLPIHLTVLIPAVENAIGSDSFRPGDILTMRNGLTVEVDNTDAEGRLILADALVKACEDKPELIIDFATLTGAARAAVGTDISAMFTDDEPLAAAISDMAVAACDPVWRLPLYKGYSSMLDSSIADLVNASAAPYAGATTAALFLQRFVDQDIAWVHFDIMAWNVGSKPGKPEGGEAMGMQAMAYYLTGKYG